MVPAPPAAKSRRFALTLNLFLPGTGQWYLGQTVLGAIYAAGFLACFLGMLVLFLRGYQRYLDLSTSGQLLENVDLDELARSFHTPWLFALLLAALAIYVASLLTLRRPADARPPIAGAE